MYLQGLGGGDGQSAIIDDLYILDNVDSGIAGMPNDDFLGDVRVEVIRPSGNGNSSDWIGQDANSTDNYLNVDETTPDGDTTYNESDVVDDKDTYAYSNLSTVSGTVYGVLPTPYIRKTDSGTREFASVARLSTTEDDGPSTPLSTSYQYLQNALDGNPDGDPWTIADVNSAEFGPKVTV